MPSGRRAREVDAREELHAWLTQHLDTSVFADKSVLAEQVRALEAGEQVTVESWQLAYALGLDELPGGLLIVQEDGSY
jgi:hypothetical protein